MTQKQSDCIPFGPFGVMLIVAFGMGFLMGGAYNEGKAEASLSEKSRMKDSLLVEAASLNRRAHDILQRVTAIDSSFYCFRRDDR